MLMVPGEKLFDEPRKINGTYVENGATYVSTVALFDNERKNFAVLEGGGMPRIEDIVIGTITGSRNRVYSIELSYFGKGLLIEGKYEKYSFNDGDIISARIKDIEYGKTVILVQPRTLIGGTIINMKLARIPRFIGRENTMVNMVSELTKTKIIVGKNGSIWIKGENEDIVMSAIEMVEKESHVSGLTDKVKEMIEKKLIQKEKNKV